jgi:hypothetical protein
VEEILELLPEVDVFPADQPSACETDAVDPELAEFDQD